MRFLPAAILILIAACDTPTEPDDRWAVPEDIDYAPSLGIDLDAMNHTVSGLYWADSEMGYVDDPAVGIDDEVRFHYTIWLPDGRQIETTIGGPAHQNQVILLIEGVAEGIIGMHRGGKRRLVIPPDLGWPGGRDEIPPISTIIFDIELLAIVAP
jgi:FKBP-type peptidyl-prolyl cis-trans isomerase FkpA